MRNEDPIVPQPVPRGIGGPVDPVLVPQPVRGGIGGSELIRV